MQHVSATQGQRARGLLRAWCKAVAGMLGIAAMPQAGAVGLMAFYGMALERDPAYLAAGKERDAGHEERAKGRAGLLPSISFRYRNTRSHTNVNQATAFGERRSGRSSRSQSSAVTLEQPIFDYAAISAYYYGVAQARQADERYRGRSQALAVRVAQAYMNALYAVDQIDLVRAQKRAYEAEKLRNERWLTAGEGNRTDVLETQARFDLALAQEIEARDGLDVALQALAALVGREVRAQDLDPLGRGFVVAPLEPGDFAYWRRTALAGNAELAALRHAVDAADRMIGRARAGHMPRVTAQLSAARETSHLANSRAQQAMTSSIGLQVSIPIFSGGGTSAALRQAVDNKERLRLESEARALEVLNELRRQFNLYNSSAAKLKAYRLAAASARELILAVRKSVASGERVNADVLDAEQRYFDALRNLAQARYAYLQAGLKIRYLAGTLAASDVRAVSEYFVQGGGRSGADHASAPPRF